MGMEQQLEKMQQRKEYRNVWHIDLMGTVTADTLYCCFACFCGPCVSYLLRKQAIYNDMSRYKCCAGYMPCSGKCGESKCPQLCLLSEVCCCFASSVSSTRFLIQDELNIQTTPCDNCMIGFMLILKQVACICTLIACITGDDSIGEIADYLSCISDTVFCSVCACIQSQHHIELLKRDGKLRTVLGAPKAQQMSRDRAGGPSSAGYY